MLNIPLFFRQHELSADADERSVKRVYARQLKKIDQEVDPARFQALREAYEHALDWIKHRDRTRSEKAEYKDADTDQRQDGKQDAQSVRHQESQRTQAEIQADIQTGIQAEAQTPSHAGIATDSVAAAAQHHDEPTKSDESVKSAFESIRWPEPVRPSAPRPEQASTTDSFSPDAFEPPSPQGVESTPASSGKKVEQQAAQALASHSPTTAAERVFAEMLMAMRAHSGEIGFAEENLQRTMDDSRLYNTEARYAFETLVAAYLVRGWRQGNGDLFDAAFNYFSWAKDRRRLLSLGRPGHVLERAYKEMLAFNARPAAFRKARRELLLQLRVTRSPSPAYLKAHFKKMDVLSQLYPTWIWMVTSKDNFAAWKALFTVQPEGARSAPGAGAESAAASDEDVHSASWSIDDKGDFAKSPRTLGKLIRRYLLPLFLCAFVLSLLMWVIREAKTPVTAQAAGHQAVVPKTPAEKFDAATRQLNTKGISQESARKAISELVQLAESGYVLASYQLGWIYREGKNSTPDETEARKWFVKAAQQGNLQAAVMTGDYYFEGRGGNKDLAEGLRW